MGEEGPRPNLLRERAEDYTPKEISQLEFVNRTLIWRLEEYLFSDIFDGKPCVLLGDKGCGKTFNLIKTLGRGIYELDDFTPVMFAYKKTAEIEMLNPLLLAPRKAWGEKLWLLRRVADDRKKLLEAASAIVFDDFHYVCEAVERGEYPSSDLVKFLEDVMMDVVEKRVIIASADQLSKYSAMVNDRGFDRLLPKFGFYSSDGRYDRRVDVLARVETPVPSFESWKRIFGNLRIEADEIVQGFLYKCTHNPRAAVRFAKLFGGKITRSDLRGEAVGRIKSILKSRRRRVFGEEFFELLFNLPSISTHFEKMLGGKKGGTHVIKKCEERLRIFGEIAEEVASRLKPPELDDYESEKWKKDPVYAVRARYLESPLGKRVVRQKLDEVVCENPDYRESKGEFLSFILNPQLYKEFLDDLRRMEKKTGRYFQKILDQFSTLFGKIGSEWFPIDPCRVAFHDVLYGTPASPYLVKRLMERERPKKERGIGDGTKELSGET